MKPRSTRRIAYDLRHPFQILFYLKENRIKKNTGASRILPFARISKVFAAFSFSTNISIGFAQLFFLICGMAFRPWSSIRIKMMVQAGFLVETSGGIHPKILIVRFNQRKRALLNPFLCFWSETAVVHF